MWLCTPVNTVLERPRQEDLGLATSQPRQVIEHGSPARDPASLPSLPPSPSQELQPGEDAYSYGSCVTYEKPRGRKSCAPNSGLFWNLLLRPSSPPIFLLSSYFLQVYVYACVCARVHAHWRKCGGPRSVNQVKLSHLTFGDRLSY